MSEFVISIKKDGDIFHSLEKIPFDLNPKKDIVKQVEEKVSDLLCDSGSDLQVSDIAWKVYRNDGGHYAFVSRSENWVGD